MLVAPAGYGKTTLARQWLATSVHPFAWFAATPSSVDVAALAMGLHRAVSSAHPEIGRILSERLPITPNPHVEIDVLAEVLADDLTPWPEKSWLVIDDYQEIAGVAAPERFVETFLLSSSVNLLLLTRERPAWASARRILYGEIAEYGRDALAMTYDEAAALLASPSRVHPELLEVTEGWPAVLALAAISPSSSKGPPMASALYRFFADELYYRINEPTRRGLWEIALMTPTRRATIMRMLGSSRGTSVIEVGTQHGFLTEREGDLIEIHPLLRHFLEEKLLQESVQLRETLVERAFRHFLERGSWDEAFHLIARFELPPLLPRLLAASLPELLTLGRTETLRRWISRGDAAVTDPIVGLTGAELAFREGHYYASEVLAEAAAGSANASGHTAARALIVAGRAAHAASREQESLAFYRRAKKASSSEELGRVALMGELVAAIELEVPGAVELSKTLESSSDLLPQERVVLAGRILNLQTRYALRVDLDAGRAARQLLHLVDDPLARCSFRNVFGYVLAACGKCEEALSLTDEQLSDAERSRLNFVIPYALCVRALSRAGQRYFDEAQEQLAKAEQLATKTGDRTAVIICRCLRARTFIAQGSFQPVFSESPHTHGLTNSLASELLASHALARAGAGDAGKAFELALTADKMSGASETKICVPAARAVANLRLGRSDVALLEALEALRTAIGTGMIESFVAAYRGCPELLTCLLQEKNAHEDIALILTLSGDQVMQNVTATHSVLALSPREKEVLSLLGFGMTNAQIAQQLFISLATVKVHVRHIFEKLGVDSRTAAALRAVQIGRDHAAPEATNDGSV